jgi:hypothetical protein
MVRCVPLEQVHTPIDFIDQPGVPGKFDHRTDACVVDGLCAIRQLILDGIGPDDWVGIGEASRESIGSGIRESFEDLLLANCDAICETVVHLNSSVVAGEYDVLISRLTRNRWGILVFSAPNHRNSE